MVNHDIQKEKWRKRAEILKEIKKEDFRQSKHDLESEGLGLG